MGLKKANHKINGYEYPQAYAVFNGEIKKIGSQYRASFNIHATRDLAINEKPIETKSVIFEWDRKSDIVATAYAKGKEQMTVKRLNIETQEMEEVLVDGPFTGWTDDIVEE